MVFFLLPSLGSEAMPPLGIQYGKQYHCEQNQIYLTQLATFSGSTSLAQDQGPTSSLHNLQCSLADHKKHPAWQDTLVDCHKLPTQ